MLGPLYFNFRCITNSLRLVTRLGSTLYDIILLFLLFIYFNLEDTVVSQDVGIVTDEGLNQQLDLDQEEGLNQLVNLGQMPKGEEEDSATTTDPSAATMDG